MAGTNPKDPIKASPAEIRERSAKLLHIYKLPPIDLSDDKQVQDRIYYYFDYCEKEGLKPVIEGLALALGVTRQALYDWEIGRRRGDVGSSRADMVKKAKEYIAYMMSDGVMNGKVNPVAWIFYAKNYFGMSDKQEIEVKAAGQLLPTMSPEEIAKQIPQDIPVDVDWKEE